MVHINETLCIGCGKCVSDCLAFNLKLNSQKASVVGDCLLCGHCAAICPAAAVSIPEYDMADTEDYQPEAFDVNPENLLHTIKFRRSIRDYKAIPVEQEKLEYIAQAGRYTATAKNNQDSHFIFIQKELSVLKEMVWNYIDHAVQTAGSNLPESLLPYAGFLKRRSSNPADDYLFRNAPAVVFVTSDWPLDAGLAAQNMELMAVTQGLGVLFNGYLSRIADENEELKAWLGIEGKTIKACMLMGYPNVAYERTAPRRSGNFIWK